MRPFAAFERIFERIFERPAARLFHLPLQPVQIERRIERAMENERLTGSERTLAPNRYAVHLHPADLAGFADIAGGLAAELADAALTYARAHRYQLVDRPQVALVPDGGVPRGEIRVAARFLDAGLPVLAAATPESAAGEWGGEQSAVPPAAGAVASATAGSWRQVPDTVPDTQTRVFEVPQVRGPRARLRLVRPDGTHRDVRVDGSLLTIGRARDNDLVLHDARASRYHARLQARAGSLVLTDLGSTNGTRVNGQLVEAVALGLGDRIELGDSTLIVESGPEPWAEPEADEPDAAADRPGSPG